MISWQDGPAQPRPGQSTEAGAAAGKKTVESVSAADALMDALELAAHEAERLQVQILQLHAGLHPVVKTPTGTAAAIAIVSILKAVDADI